MHKKFHSQKDAILYALFCGERLSILNCFINFGCTKISTRIHEYASEIGFMIKKEQINFKTRYGTDGSFYNYSLDRKYNEGVVKLAKYLADKKLLIEPKGDITDKQKRFRQTSILDYEKHS